ncbi:hypothetical protein EMIHUDRAFT_202909 [Emiliania huxleyi CCMP1516]|uniref:RNase NYN domain-containing protein n=2 Tax=Emiliania huxleyi TaxID=2903 RepID=A0A0D3K911_EMIH1|nr:hypothetical protein EMIHUDRAFT_202909 [Emiliania huxleyi CCMP1516]EOD32246.1 hypothetical protein EMIHUDRAFT_202909 [Emiliania huxleyi CCMP1516]|eukprot:XP_005784675.1 hypothetical protein EMIHUDRAFT_202909 [Emiliania huxleyi CCMP1516]
MDDDLALALRLQEEEQSRHPPAPAGEEDEAYARQLQREEEEARAGGGSDDAALAERLQTEEAETSLAERIRAGDEALARRFEGEERRLQLVAARVGGVGVGVAIDCDADVALAWQLHEEEERAAALRRGGDDGESDAALARELGAVELDQQHGGGVWYSKHGAATVAERAAPQRARRARQIVSFRQDGSFRPSALRACVEFFAREGVPEARSGAALSAARPAGAALTPRPVPVVEARVVVTLSETHWQTVVADAWGKSLDAREGVAWTPTGTDDDLFTIQLAASSGAWVVTNDRFENHPAWAAPVRGRLVRFAFAGASLFVPAADDLDRFRQAASVAAPRHRHAR